MTEQYKPNRVLLATATGRVADGNSLAGEAIAVAETVSRLTERGELALALDAADLAAKSARHAARKYTRAADAMRLEGFRQAGGSVVPSGQYLHQREREARGADKFPGHTAGGFRRRSAR